MPQYIHRKGNRYRVWSTVVDAYVTRSMTRVEMYGHLRAEIAREIEERLARADAQGTSHQFEKRDTKAWEQERCRHCEEIHHAFDPTDKGRCRECGEAEDYRSHAPPCKARRKASA